MLTFLKTAAVIAAMFLIIPLAVWAGSGSWREALRAFKSYTLIMLAFFGAGWTLAVLLWLASGAA